MIGRYHQVAGMHPAHRSHRDGGNLLSMPNTIPPQEVRDLFDEPALAHVSYLNRKGQIVAFPIWVDFDGEHILVSSPMGSRKGKVAS